ncbi:MAG: hypothetical protein M4579_002326 [Chaenotheca gracillima]|nr:MAG: hypothetical protein M4579_002326 [Chaenotheca gracillima]
MHSSRWLIATICFTCTFAADELLPFVFQPLPLGSVKPEGWLRDQMQLMSDGLAGHEHDFYQFVADSSWLGGDQEYSSLNEGFPYWFNGIVPLAYGLDDARLKGQVTDAVDYLLAHQADDGWIGPETTVQTRNFWARYPLFLGLIQLAEANATESARVVPALHKFMTLMHSMLADNYAGYTPHDGDVFDASWGQVRSHDMIITLQWLYENHPENNSQVLLDNMNYINEKAYDWAYWFSNDVFITADLDTVPIDLTTRMFPYEHGVSAGQGLKAGAVVRRFTNNDTLLQSTRDGVNWTFTYHGAASGTIIADERLAGLSPLRGSELCTAVETMYSMSYLYQAIGDNDFADKSELAAFNALPVMMTPDWWAHQYMAEPNQTKPYSLNLTESPFWNVNTVGQTFGLEPNYPCCTVNHPQGYPKFLSASIVKVGDIGLGHALLSPASAYVTLANSNDVFVNCSTNYPFENVLQYTIRANSAFDFYVRVPGWYVDKDSSISVNGGKSGPLAPDPSTGMHKLSLDGGDSTVTYTLGVGIVVEQRANDTVAVRYGSLLYAVDVTESVQILPPTDYGSQQTLASKYVTPQTHDYRINGTSPWAVAIDPSTLRYTSKSSNTSTAINPLPNPIFTSGAPPGSITVSACSIEWGYFKGVPANPPLKGNRNCTGDVFEVKMIPYGAAKLHMAELPVTSLDVASSESEFFDQHQY